MSTIVNPTPPAVGRLTAEEFARKHAGDYVELIDGNVATLTGTGGARHGAVCARSATLLGGFIDGHKLGVICSNNSFVVVARNPDRVRGPDIVYWAADRLPGGKVPDEELIFAPPTIVVEVMSPDKETYDDVFTKVGEYLTVGVTVDLVLDPDSQTVSTYRTTTGQQTFAADAALTLPDVLPEFAIPVRRFFE